MAEVFDNTLPAVVPMTPVEVACARLLGGNG